MFSISAPEKPYTIEDVAYELRDSRDAFRYDPALLEQTESRLASIQNLKRKYGATIAEILAYRDKIEKEYSVLNDGENQVDALERAYREAVDTFGSLAEQLSARRKAAAKELMRRTIAELNEILTTTLQTVCSLMS